PADLPSSQTDEPVLTSLYFASRTERGRLPGTHAMTHGYRARHVAFSNGRNRLLNDDGVANADTPPSTSQSNHAANRHARAAARPMGMRLPQRSALACQTTASAN